MPCVGERVPPRNTPTTPTLSIISRPVEVYLPVWIVATCCEAGGTCLLCDCAQLQSSNQPAIGAAVNSFCTMACSVHARRVMSEEVLMPSGSLPGKKDS